MQIRSQFNTLRMRNCPITSKTNSKEEKENNKIIRIDSHSGFKHSFCQASCNFNLVLDAIYVNNDRKMLHSLNSSMGTSSTYVI